MSKQPEQILENQLVAQLQQLKYEKTLIKDENALVANLKTQLEKHNNTYKKTICKVNESK
ncbi:hypothetical protein [Flavicella sp.]|uniref:hypothetical protein n=1 Tax=Flavicella sp. TaxID=2957742 RepID=UPI00301A2690